MDHRKHTVVLLVLATLSALGPFSVDMYLPGFPAIAEGLHTDIAHVAFSLTSYFIGMAVGQIAYGPVMDRYGRRRPLLTGLALYVVAALGCALSPSIHFLISLRLFLALGGCVGLVGSRTVVRDLFSGSEIARVLSMLMMVFGIAPIVAPTIGGLVVAGLGWRAIFLILALIATLIFIAVYHFLPESKGPDHSVSLHPRRVMIEYVNVYREPAFLRYTLANAASTAAFFAYISGSPFVYMKLLGFTETQFGWLYGGNVLGLIIAAQLNRISLRRRSSTQVVLTANAVQAGIGLLLLASVYFGLIGAAATVGGIFCFLFCFGFVGPNAIALALQPFTKNAGSASALMGSIQMVTAALSSALVSYLHNRTAIPMLGLMAVCALICLVLLRRGPGSPLMNGSES